MAASLWTNVGRADLANRGITGGTFRLLLLTNDAPAAGTVAEYNTVAAVTAALTELSGTGYIGGAGGSGRRTLSGLAVIEGTYPNPIYVDATDPAAWAGVNAGTIKSALVYRRVGGSDVDASDIPWCILDSPDIVTVGADVTLLFSSTGISTV